MCLAIPARVTALEDGEMAVVALEGVKKRISVALLVEVAVGDYVLTGGELPAAIVVDAVARLVPGVLGEVSQALERVAEEAHWPHSLIISNWI